MRFRCTSLNGMIVSISFTDSSPKERLSSRRETLRIPASLSTLWGPLRKQTRNYSRTKVLEKYPTKEPMSHLDKMYCLG